MKVLNREKEDKEKDWIWMIKGWKGRGKGKKEGMDEIDEINEMKHEWWQNGKE